MLKKDKLTIPAQLTFEALAKGFMNIAIDRNPRPDKIIQLASQIVGDSLILQMIVITQWRDAVNEVSPVAIYKNQQHKEAISQAIIACLEDLEDKIEQAADEEE